jgi:hypothetical protein
LILLWLILTFCRCQTKTVLFEVMTSSTYELPLKNGADVHVKNSWHETPLHFQCYSWSSRLVRVLLAAGADVNAVNKVRACTGSDAHGKLANRWSTTQRSTTPLDNAIFRKPSQRKADDEEFMEVCRLLLRRKAVVSWSRISSQKAAQTPTRARSKLDCSSCTSGSASGRRATRLSDSPLRFSVVALWISRRTTALSVEVGEPP